MKLKFTLGCVLAVLLLPSSAFGQATRTWVSGVGDDANPCSRTAPCKTWAGAISKTFINGEIDALDPGGFGSVTITKSITLDGAATTEASILSSGVSGVNVNLTSSVADDPLRKVVLRNLSINGTGASGTAGTNTGIHGISVTNTGNLQLENVKIFNFGQNGVDFTPSGTGDMTLTLDHVNVGGNTGSAVLVKAANATQKINVIASDSVFENNGVGITADTGSHVWLTRTTVFGNPIGLRSLNSVAGGAAGVLDSFCDNAIVEPAGNTHTDPNPLCPPTVVTNTVTNNTNTVTQLPGQTVEVVKCTVPKLTGLALSFAKRLLSAANCSTGAVTKRKAKKSKVGKVLSQGTKAGTKLAAGTKVSLVVGKK